MARVPPSERTRNELKGMFAGKRSADLARLSQRELNAVAARLNNRPRKTLDWMTQNEA